MIENSKVAIHSKRKQILLMPATWICLLTGATALIYEVVWARWLVLALGAGSASLAVTVASIMCGLAVGSMWGGRLADKAANPLRLFGWLQVLVGLCAFPVSMLLRSIALSEISTLPYIVLLTGSFLLVTVPATFMGATMPVLILAVGKSRETYARNLGQLYAANTAGALVGTLITGFFLIETIGLFLTVIMAVCGNLAAGIVAFAISAREMEGEARHFATSSTPGPVCSAALLGAGVSGFSTMAFQVLDSRLLVHGLLGTTHALTLILAIFLFGLALGAHICSKKLLVWENLGGKLGIALISAAIIAFLLAPSLARSATLAVLIRTAAVSWPMRLFLEALIVGVLLFPSTFMMGFAFPISAAYYNSATGSATGRIFMVNAFSGVAGALLAGFVLLPLLGLRGAVVAIAVIYALGGAWFISREPSWRAWQQNIGWAIVALFIVAGYMWAQPPKIGGNPGQGTLVAQHIVGNEQDYRTLCYSETLIATTAVVEQISSGVKDLLIDGFVTAGDAPTAGYMALMGTLPAKLHPAPRQALVICFGTGATARAVAAFPRIAIDLVDINPDVFRCAPFFSPDNQLLLSKARLFVEDGRRFLGKHGSSYDIITQEPMPPYFAGTAALYSVEYYRLARRRLSADGILIQWLPLHLVAPKDAREIAAAAQAVFPETWIALAPSDRTGLVVSSVRPLQTEMMKQAQKELGVVFVLNPQGVRRYSAGVKPLSDDRPTLEYSGIDRVRQRFPQAVQLHEYNIAQLLDAQNKKRN